VVINPPNPPLPLLPPLPPPTADVEVVGFPIKECIFFKKLQKMLAFFTIEEIMFKKNVVLSKVKFFENRI
jgi:hypothetical protein